MILTKVFILSLQKKSSCFSSSEPSSSEIKALKERNFELERKNSKLENQANASTANAAPAPATSLLLQRQAVVLETLADNGKNLERFRQSVTASKSHVNKIDRNDFIEPDIKDMIKDSFASYATTALTTQAKALINGWENHESWDDTRFFDVMRAVFNTEQAKACHTSQDFDTWIKQSPEKDFLIGKVYAKTAATLTAIKAAAKSLHVNLPAQAGEGGKH